jgi:hypothetical protein
MYSVIELGMEEESLQKRMPQGGHIEQRDEYLNEHGLYEAWREIYAKYVTLAKEGDLEALKRALFFAWYQLSEPSWLSGIGDLPDGQTLIVVNLIEERLAQGLKDPELDYMLPYYMTVCSYYLERFYPLPYIVQASNRNTEVTRLDATGSDWSHRGQMGEYWGECA